MENDFVKIASSTFSGNPAVNWMLPQDARIEKRYQNLARYLFKELRPINAFQFSECRKGVLVSYFSGTYKPKKLSLNTLRFVFLVIGPRSLAKVLKRSAQIEKIRYQGKHIYVYFYGVHPSVQGSKAAFELRDFIFDKSKKHALPVVAETAIPRIKTIYERFGFETYAEHRSDDGQLTTWLLKRDASA